MQKWEYCALGPINGSAITRYPFLLLYTEGGLKVTRLWKKGTQEGSAGFIASVIARLGNTGWELVGVGGDSRNPGHYLYFKRPKE